MMSFEVTPDGGEPYRVTAASRDVLAWEKAGKGRSFGQLSSEDSMSMAALYGLSYFAARRLGLFVGSLPEWEQQVDIMPTDGDTEGDAVDPTPPAPTAGSSSPSHSPRESRPASGRKKEPPR